MTCSFLSGGERGLGIADMGQRCYAPAKRKTGSRTRRGTMYRATTMEWFDREVRTNENRGGSEGGGALGFDDLVADGVVD